MTGIFLICCICDPTFSSDKPFCLNSVIMPSEFLYICSKFSGMKRKLLFAVSFVIIALSFNSCEEGCKICQQNTYNSGGDLITAGSETEYCDAALLRIESTPDVTVAGITTKWVCR
jgi:hypothetical protein